MLNTVLDQYRERHGRFLAAQLDQQSAVAPELIDAMQYAVLLGGKRVRPFLVYAVGNMLGARDTDLDAPAAAIECIHAYSLVHDDLPAMDDDALRRGKPTCHIAFDEATAILAGDALQSFAFELLSGYKFEQVTSAQQLAMVRTLANASGQGGMCGGQALDLAATDNHIDRQQLETIHRHKTGALIEAAVQLGIQASTPPPVETSEALLTWAQTIGLAFQVQDDILDEIGETETLGKPQGSDREQHKATYPTLMGLEQAQALLRQLHEKALQGLHAIPYNTQLLEDFTDFLITRDR
ncbi:(2E,6E)-farnesyl diphosphate synthase [Aliidiomarina sp. Khilg15.8]